MNGFPLPPSTPSISGIILAAGRSERLGRVKQLLPFRGKPMLSHIVETSLGSRLHEVIVVLGYKAGEIEQTVDLGDATVIINNDYEAGQSTSLRIGLSAISDHSKAALFILGDQPLVTTEVINRLIGEYALEKKGFLIPVFQGKRGNPVLIDRSIFPRLASLTGDQGARVLFEEYADQIKEIDVGDEGIHCDVDTLDDYLRMTSP